MIFQFKFKSVISKSASIISKSLKISLIEMKTLLTTLMGRDIPHWYFDF